jgi:aminopeptidase YwaD
MRAVLSGALVMTLAGAASAHAPPLLPEAEVAAIVNELSGETALCNLEGVARFHRQRGSQGFHEAASLIAEQAKAYGLGEVSILRFPADGVVFYGTQRSRQAWDATEGELSEIVDGRETKIASYRAEPAVLAEDSESADVVGGLVDVGAGTEDRDYAGHDVKGRLVLVSAPAGAVQDIAVGRFGAAGIISYAQNQKTAWSGDDDSLIRWGHLQTFSPHKTFAFMVSLKTARGLQARLRAGQPVQLHALVKAGQHPSAYEIVTAVIPGANPGLKEQEIAYSCHLDHQRPGANDNASGCATILEVARTLQRLIDEGKLARPARTLRFIWPPEIEGTETLLNARPEFARRIKAVVHMDMVGGGEATKAVFHVTRGPRSLPSFVHDVAWAFAAWANEESYEFAAGDAAQYPLLAVEGGKEPLRAMYSAYTMGSDHDVYQDSSFKIPAVYLNDWPDRYIHTNKDSAANIDPTKLKRAAFIGAASGYFLANFSARDTAAAGRAVDIGRLMRAVTSLERHTAAGPADEYERRVRASLLSFPSVATATAAPAAAAVSTSNRADRKASSGDAADIVYRRSAEPKGPLTVFGYDYFEDHAGAAHVPRPKLLDYSGAWGSGEEYAYEALNFADGRRSVRQITDELSAECGDVPLELVVEYLGALKRIGVLQ